MFYGLKENRAVYGRVTSGEEYEYYEALLALTNLKGRTNRRIKAELMAAAEIYTKRMLLIWVDICGLRTFKDQDGVYQGWGPPGDFMMMRVVDYARKLEKKYGRIILQHDNKRCDLGATMIGYYDRFIGSLKDKLNIDHSYLRYDTMNIVIYMGKDVTLLDEVNNKKNYIPAQGLKLMREKGKGIIIVDKTSNDTGKDYQELFIPARDKTLEMCIAEDVNTWAIQYGLIKDGLSPL